MGFDVSGINPRIREERSNYELFDSIESIDDWKERWTMIDKLNDDDRSKFYKEMRQWEGNNPGIYFRNNVWWWRPLWDFVCAACSKILNEEDISAGHFNDGKEINADKATKIADKLFTLLSDGTVKDYEESFNKDKEELIKSKDKDKKFFGNYPFEESNVRRFAEFCKDSGGFVIC